MFKVAKLKGVARGVWWPVRLDDGEDTQKRKQKVFVKSDNALLNIDSNDLKEFHVSYRNEGENSNDLKEFHVSYRNEGERVLRMKRKFRTLDAYLSDYDWAISYDVTFGNVEPPKKKKTQPFDELSQKVETHTLSGNDELSQESKTPTWLGNDELSQEFEMHTLSGNDELSQEVEMPTSTGNDELSQEIKMPTPTGNIEVSQEEKMPTPIGNDERSQEVKMPTPTGNDELSQDEKMPTSIGNDELSQEVKMPTPTGNDELSQEEKMPTPTGNDELSQEVKMPTPTGNDELSKEVKMPTPIGNDELSQEVKMPTSTGNDELSQEEIMPTPISNDELSQEEEMPTPIGNDDLSQEVKMPTPTGNDELSQEEEMSTPIGNDDLSQEVKMPTPTGNDELSQEVKMPTPIGNDELSQEEKMPTPTGKDDLSQEVRMPTLIGNDELSQEEKMPTPIGNDDLSQEVKMPTPTGNDELSQEEKMPKPIGNDELSQEVKKPTPTGNDELSQEEKMPTPTGNNKQSQEVKMPTPTGNDKLSLEDKMPTPTGNDELSQEVKMPTPTGNDELSQKEKMPTPTGNDELSQEVKKPTPTGNGELSKEVKIPTPTGNDELSHEVKMPTSTGNDELSQEEKMPTPLGNDEQSQEVKMPTPTGNDELSQEEKMPTSIDNDELSQEEKMPTPTGNDELSQEVEMPTPIGNDELSQEEKMPTPTGKDELSQKVRMPTLISNDELSQEEKMPTPIGNDELSQEVKMPTSTGNNKKSQEVKLPIPTGNDELSQEVKMPTPTGNDELSQEVQMPTPTGNDELSQKVKMSTLMGNDELSQEVIMPTLSCNNELSQEVEILTPWVNDEQSQEVEMPTPSDKGELSQEIKTPTPSGSDEPSQVIQCNVVYFEDKRIVLIPSLTESEEQTVLIMDETGSKYLEENENSNSAECKYTAIPLVSDQTVPNSSSDSDMSIEFPELQQTRLKKQLKKKKPTLVSSDDDDEADDCIARDITDKDIYFSLVYKNEYSKLDGKTKKSTRVYDSKHPCPFCDITVANFSHHIMTQKHEKEDAVIAIKKEADPETRKKLINLLRLKAANDHNMKVKEQKKGEIFLLRRTSFEDAPVDCNGKKVLDISKYGPCPKCFGWIVKRSIRRHYKSCSAALSETVNTPSKGELLLQSDILSGRISEVASQILKEEVFPIMQIDSISEVAKTDDLITTLGNNWMMRNRGNKVMRKYYTSSVMRLAAKLKIQLIELTKEEADLDHLFQPKYFDTTVQATLNCCNINEFDEEDLKAPSNSIKLGYDIKRMVSSKLANGIKNKDKRRIEEAQQFLDLMKLEWGIRVTRLARTILNEQSFNKSKKLPLPDDIKKLSQFLSNEVSNVKLDVCNYTNYRKVVILVLARLTLYNRRRSHEVQAMRLDSYANRKIGIDEVAVELRGELTQFETMLLETQEMVTIRGKTGKGVPVIIPEDVKDALAYIVNTNTREQVGVLSDNPYVFANNRAGVLRAYEAIKTVADNADLRHPDLIRTSNMRKYIATMLQALNTTENERQWIVDHLGHTLNRHKIHYRQTSDVLEGVDVSKMLLIQDFGLCGKYKGKSIQDIDLNDIMLNAVQDNETPSTKPKVTVNIEDIVDEDYIPVQNPSDSEDEGSDEEAGSKPIKLKVKQVSSTRQKWTKQEEEELKLLFKESFDKKKCPGLKVLRKAVKQSRTNDGVIWKRPQENIKKKVSAMLIKQYGRNYYKCKK